MWRWNIVRSVLARSPQNEVIQTLPQDLKALRLDPEKLPIHVTSLFLTPDSRINILTAATSTNVIVIVDDLEMF